MKKTIIIVMSSLLSINAFGQVHGTPDKNQNWLGIHDFDIVRPTRRLSSVYINNETGREVTIPKNLLPRRGQMVFKRDTVIIQQPEWGFRTETYFQMSDDSHTEFHVNHLSDTIKKQPFSILWGYN